MKKMDFLGGPPPPPPSVIPPLPPQESQLYSPTQYSGVYSPSRATSPHSDNEVVDLAKTKKSSHDPPPPSEPALVKPGKVLGSDQAKRRLQAFARCRTTQGPKGKVAQAFQEDEEAEAKERESEMKKKLAVATSVKDSATPATISSSSTPVMASIMKEETENRELVKRSMETLARKNEEEEERKKEKSTGGDHRRIPFEEQEDLRDVLMKKRGDKEKESGRSRSEKDKRSRSRSIKRERKSKSPRKRSRSKSWRKRSNSRSSVKRSWSRNARKRSRSRRQSLSRSTSRKRCRSKDRSRGGGAERRSRSMSSTSPRRRSSSTKRSRSSRRRSRSRERRQSKIKEESRSPQKKDADHSNSRRGRIERRLEPSEERDARRGRLGRRRRRESSSTKDSRRSGSRRRSLSSDKMKGIDEKSEMRKRSHSGGRRSRRRSRSAGRSSSARPKSMSRGRSSSHVKEQVRDVRDLSIEKDRQNQGGTDKNGRRNYSPGGGHRSSSWAENLGSGDSRVTSTSKIKERVASGEEEVVMVKVASEEDYFAVKQETRPPLADTLDLVDGGFIPVPVKYIRVTSCGGVKWSMNRMTSEASDLVLQRSLEIRKSVESAVLDLEQEVIRKKSRERSSDEKEDKGESSSSKKKKKKKSVKSSKKEKASSKKKQRLDKSSSSSSSSKKKKKKKLSKEKDAEIQHESPELKARHRSGSSASKSNSNASKLFSMAGYTDNNQQEVQMSISRSSNPSPSPSPLKASKSETSAKLDEYGWGERDAPRSKSPAEEKAGRGRPTSRNSGRHSISPLPNGSTTRGPEGREAIGMDIADQASERSGRGGEQDRFARAEFSPIGHMPPESACWGAEGGSSPPRSRSPSPSLLADLSRISSGPRSPSPGPRLPKFKDSRSPSKVPIMRDRRSPIREDGGSGSKRSSPRKREKARKSRRAQESPRGFHDSPRYHQDLLYPAESDQEGSRYKNGRRDGQDGGRYPSPSRGPCSPPPEGQTKYSPMQSASLSPSPAGKAHPRPSSRPTTPPGSPYRRAASPVHKEISGNYLSPRGPRSPFSPRRQRSPVLSPQRPFSPNDRQTPYSSSRTRSPPRGTRSPDRRGPYSSQSRTYSPRSPGRRHSRSPQGRRQAPRSPDNRRPPSPRGRRQRSPDRRPCSPRGFSPRGRSPYRNERSPRRGYYSPSMSRGGTRRPYTPPLSPRGPRSPERRRYSPDRRYSPGRRRYSPDRELRNLPDSTISDAELARQMPPPPHRHLARLPGLNSPLLGHYGASPKRLSLDERLEREHGIKVEPEPAMNPHGPHMGHHGAPLDFSRPPPGFPGGPPGPPPFGPAGGGQGQGGNQGAHGASGVGGGVHHGGPAQESNRSAAFPTHNSGGVLKAVQPHTSTPVLTTGSLPATIPTYDDSSPVKTTAPAGTRAQVEKEAATLAAQAVASKLQEMQLAKEEERRKRKEQKMAERLAAQLTEVAVDEVKKEEEVRTGTGRILDMVEKQEQHKEETEEEGEKKKDIEGKGGRKKKKERDANSPLLITLKPFYRPNEKNGKRKRAVKEIEVEEPEEDFVPRSPVPLPDGAGLKPVLVKPYLTRMKLPGFNSTEKKSKGVKYADGVLPGQGSPDHGQAAPAPPQPPSTPPPKKRYKKAILMVYETHEGDTESDEESPPPPPPGSPPRYRMAQLIEMFGKPRPVAVQS